MLEAPHPLPLVRDLDKVIDVSHDIICDYCDIRFDATTLER